MAGEIPENDISELAIPFLAMAVDADTSAPVELTSATALYAILASSALSLCSRPQRKKGATSTTVGSYDGGV